MNYKLAFTFLLSGGILTSVFSQDLLKNKEAAHTAEIRSVAINGEGTTIITGGADKRAQLWDVKSGEKIKILGHSATVNTVAFSSNGKLFATGTADGKILIF